ncbi:MAG: DUF177 domain-containing protein [Rhodospirillales bacterium]|nr:DUF177 domain-containing protein [Rhodospirillales bacterium]
MARASNKILETEWSVLFDVEEMNRAEVTMTISPDDAARARLAQRLGVMAVEALEADIRVSHHGGEVSYYLQGRIRADITQECVVTLEPIQSHIEDDFEAWFADPEAAVSIAKARHEKLNEKGHGELPILEEKDDPEALIDGKIDLGELVTQYLSLSINPYPHAEGVEYQELQAKMAVDEGADLVKNPFAALKDWKDKLSGSEN